MVDDYVAVKWVFPNVAMVRLDRPKKRNALSIALLEQLESALTEVTTTATARVVVLCGSGPVFCAGLDLEEARDPRKSQDLIPDFASILETLLLSDLVTICAVQGGAHAGGLGLLAACDIVVVTEDSRFSLPEVRRGLTPAVVTALLRRQISDRHLRELILLSESIDAQRAAAIGLVSRVVPCEQHEDMALQLANAAIAGGPISIANSKRLLDQHSSGTLVDELRSAVTQHLAARNSNEVEEGINAFLEKRTPNWNDQNKN
jgi:methylglutaconyl-CoA hydratase